MHYTGQVYRPPMEAGTPLLEVTTGCSHNSCAFCTMYRRTPFSVAPESQIAEDAAELSLAYAGTERIYLVNGDPFCLPTEKLLRISDIIHASLPKVKTISCYCSVCNVMGKTSDDLSRLADAGYNDLYVGVETAYDPALRAINKGCTAADEYEQIGKLEAAGIRYIGIFMVGVAEKGKSFPHVEATARLFNQTHPRMIGPMPLSIERGSEMERRCVSGEFQQLTEGELLEEEIMMLEALEPREGVTYWGLHVFNEAPIMGELTQRDEMVQKLKIVLDSMPAKRRDGVLRVRR